MGTLRTLNHTGDHELVWDPHDEQSVKDAEDLFERETATKAAFITPGYRAIKKFDKDAESIVVVPPVSGG
jgi:hypothetical protein